MAREPASTGRSFVPEGESMGRNVAGDTLAGCRRTVVWTPDRYRPVSIARWLVGILRSGVDGVIRREELVRR